MSKYQIKNYQEEFLEAQETVGKEATKDWKGFGQTNAAGLKELYSREGFDPETKFYAFEGEKLVGFLTSNILPVEDDGIKKARLEFPITLADHEDAAELLFNEAIATLQKKGVKKLLTRVGDAYLGTQEKAKKWGYSFSENLYVLLQADVNDLHAKEIDISVDDFNIERDLEDMVRIFVDKLGQTEDYSRRNFDRITNDKDNFPIHIIIRDNDQIVARALAYKNPNNPKDFNLGTMYLQDNCYFEPLLSEIINKLKTLGAEKTSTFLFGPTLSMEELYCSFGFVPAGKIDMYEKEI